MADITDNGLKSQVKKNNKRSEKQIERARAYRERTYTINECNMWDYAITCYSSYLYENIPSRFKTSPSFTQAGNITDSQPALGSRLNPEAAAFIPGATRHGAGFLTNTTPENSKVHGNIELHICFPRPDTDVHTYVNDFNVSGHDNGHDVTNGLKVGRKKKKKRSAKQMERARKYRERKYGQSITCFYENTETRCSRITTDGDIDAIGSEEKDPLSQSVESAGLDGTTEALSEDNLIEECGIFGVLGMYANSGLHYELEESAKIIKEATDDEDFGYEYFSLQNLLK